MAFDHTPWLGTGPLHLRYWLGNLKVGLSTGAS